MQELLVHCYRLLGSVHEAESVMAELRLDADQPRAELYRRATELCLAKGGRRLPTDLVDASDDPEGPLNERHEVRWLEPIPDATAGSLEYIAGLQRLPPRDRTVLVVRDLAGFSEPEAAAILGRPAYDVSRSLYDARSRLGEIRGADGIGPAQRALLDRYATAFQDYDVPAIVAEFTADAVWEMPPFTSWFRGARNIGRLISTHCPAKGPGDQVLVPIEANGQPGFAVYMRDPVTKTHRAFQIQVLTLTAAGVVHAIAFFDLSLLTTFQLPEMLTGMSDSPVGQPPQRPLTAERDRDANQSG